MKTINFNDGATRDIGMDAIFEAIDTSEWIEDYVDACVSFVSDPYFNKAVEILKAKNIVVDRDYSVS